MTVLAPLVRGK